MFEGELDLYLRQIQEEYGGSMEQLQAAAKVGARFERCNIEAIIAFEMYRIGCPIILIDQLRVILHKVSKRHETP